MRELTNRDQMEASMWADKNIESALRGNLLAENMQEMHEAIRLSIVEVDGEKVGADGVPFKALDEYSMRTMRALRAYFSDLNGVDEDDIKKSIAGAVIR